VKPGPCRGKDLTAATLAELRFNSIAGWLPEDEASALRAAFQCEINRLYIIADAGEVLSG
jgi:hypothetical protein